MFVVKTFRRFQRKEKIDDDALCEAIKRAEQGLIDAELGGCLIKQRVARKGQGKRGGYRTIVAYREGDRSVFLHGFAKSGQDNIHANDERTMRKTGKALLLADEDRLEALVDDGTILELEYDG